MRHQSQLGRLTSLRNRSTLSLPVKLSVQHFSWPNGTNVLFPRREARITVLCTYFRDAEAPSSG